MKVQSNLPSWLADTAYVGVDPGSTGAAAFIAEDGTVLAVETLKSGPVLAGAMDRGTLFSKIPEGYRFIVMIEDLSGFIGGHDGSSATSLFGNAWNMCAVAAMFSAYPCFSQAPRSWKSKMRLTGDKKLSLKAASAYPGAMKFVKTGADHDKAEAILLGQYLRMMVETGKLSELEGRGERLLKQRQKSKAARARKKAKLKEERLNNL